jgi:hypothetical protein
MDNLNPNSNNAVENLVRRILSSVRDMQELGSINTDEANHGHGRSSADSAEEVMATDELNRRLRIPWNETHCKTPGREIKKNSNDSSTSSVALARRV